MADGDIHIEVDHDRRRVTLKEEREFDSFTINVGGIEAKPLSASINVPIAAVEVDEDGCTVREVSPFSDFGGETTTGTFRGYLRKG